MFALLKDVLQKRNCPDLVLDLTGLPSWLEEQEEGYREEFRQAVGDGPSRILLSYAAIREQVLPLRSNLLFNDDGTALSAAVSGLLERFENAPDVLYSGTCGEDIGCFCRDAERVVHCCESGLADFREVLIPAYPELVAALKAGASGIRAEIRLMAPAYERYSACSCRLAELEQIYTRLYTLAGNVQSSAEEEIRASTRVAAYREQIAAIDEDLAQIKAEAGPASPEEMDNVRQQQRRIVQDNLAQSFHDYASILLGLTIRAEELSVSRDDDIAAGVFLELREILDGRDVPGADTLFSSLIDAFPIFMDLVDDGALILADENEQAVFTDIASFSNGLQDICLCYHEMNEKGNLMSVPVPQTPEETRQELLRDREAIIAKVMEESDHILRAHLLLTVTADDRTDLVQMIEDGIRNMTGRPAQILPGSIIQMA
ncbi:MAG: hypothetical protein GYA23_00670 [Methanomicrobiales archaeon]|nr:hypothetical protein [Methanomicrobiales archaeon]